MPSCVNKNSEGHRPSLGKVMHDYRAATARLNPRLMPFNRWCVLCETARYVSGGVFIGKGRHRSFVCSSHTWLVSLLKALRT
jgi:hypothetical protein